MAISQSNYVDITSAVAGAAASGSPSLQHRRFSPAASLTVGVPITIMASQIDQLDELLTDPEDRAFARQYFGIKTTAPANKPSSIQFVGYTGTELVDAYMMSRAYSKDFGSLSFRGIESVTDTEALEELADYQRSLNVEHQLYVSLSSLEDLATSPVYTAFQGVPMVGFVLNGTAGEYKEAIPAGLIAATDFEGTNTVNSIMYRQASGFTPDVDNDADKLLADAALVNYYGQTAANATTINFFQKGVLNGGVADPRDMMVAAGEQWIKAKIGSDLINLFVTSRVPANLDGQTRVRTTIVNGAIQAALGSGAIQPLKELTPLQREVIFDMTNDENAASDVFQEGYWLNVEIRTVVVDGLEERHAYYTLIYSKADFVRKVVGSHNLV